MIKFPFFKPNILENRVAYNRGYKVAASCRKRQIPSLPITFMLANLKACMHIDSSFVVVVVVIAVAF